MHSPRYLKGKYTRHSMSTTHDSTEKHREAGHYEIHVKGHLDDRWADWFDGLTITRVENGETLLAGPVADQAALHGLITKLRDLALPLLSVNRIEPTQTTESDTEPR